jgi:hypothetical protein
MQEIDPVTEISSAKCNDHRILNGDSPKARTQTGTYIRPETIAETRQAREAKPEVQAELKPEHQPEPNSESKPELCALHLNTENPSFFQV